jgi:ribosomal protein S15P/S13E
MATDLVGMKPGVIKGHRQYPKRNTCANSSLHKRLTRAKAGIEKHLEMHPRDSMSVRRISTITSILKGA